MMVLKSKNFGFKGVADEAINHIILTFSIIRQGLFLRIERCANLSSMQNILRTMMLMQYDQVNCRVLTTDQITGNKR